MPTVPGEATKCYVTTNVLTLHKSDANVWTHHARLVQYCACNGLLWDYGDVWV